MAWYDCLQGGGGHWNETVLWTNPSPTANFAAQSVTLSQSIDNFDYIKLTSRLSTSKSDESSLIMSVTEFKNTTWSGPTAYGLAIVGYTTSSNAYKRWACYTDSTTVRFDNATQWSGSTASNGNLIPTAISGLKFG